MAFTTHEDLERAEGEALSLHGDIEQVELAHDVPHALRCNRWLSWPHPLLPAVPSDDRASAPAVPLAPRRAVPSSSMTYSSTVDLFKKKTFITTAGRDTRAG